MPLFSAQATLKGKSGIPEDVYINTFHFEKASAPTEAEISSLAGWIIGFYNLPIGGNAPIRDFLSPVVATTGHRIKIVRLDDPKPRVPVHDEEFPLLAPTAGTALPTEVACCLSFKAARVSGVNMARRRGRVYIGPLRTTVMSPDGFGNPRPATPFVDTLQACAKALQDNTFAEAWIWVVHSPTTGGLARYPVARSWVDDAFDTVRRRGAGITSRVEQDL